MKGGFCFKGKVESLGIVVDYKSRWVGGNCDFCGGYLLYVAGVWLNGREFTWDFGEDLKMKVREGRATLILVVVKFIVF